MSSQDFSPAPYPFYTEAGVGPEFLAAVPRTRDRYWVHALLFVLTMLTTTMVGAALQTDFDRNLPFDVEHSLETYATVWQHPAHLFAGLPFSLTLAAILLAHEFGARLGRANARGVRRGWCPVCKPSDRSTALAVHTGDADDQWFYCHRCGVHGDAYAAIQIAYGLPFREAVAKLAALGGMPLPEAAPTRSAPRPSAAAWRPFEYRPAREVGR